MTMLTGGSFDELSAPTAGGVVPAMLLAPGGVAETVLVAGGVAEAMLVSGATGAGGVGGFVVA